MVRTSRVQHQRPPIMMTITPWILLLSCHHFTHAILCNTSFICAVLAAVGPAPWTMVGLYVECEWCVQAELKDRLLANLTISLMATTTCPPSSNMCVFPAVDFENWLAQFFFKHPVDFEDYAENGFFLLTISHQIK